MRGKEREGKERRGKERGEREREKRKSKEREKRERGRDGKERGREGVGQRQREGGQRQNLKGYSKGGQKLNYINFKHKKYNVGKGEGERAKRERGKENWLIIFILNSYESSY